MRTEKINSIIGDRLKKGTDNAKVSLILSTILENQQKHTIWRCLAEAVVVELAETNRLKKLNRYIRVLPINSFSMLTYIRHASNNNYVHRNVLLAEVFNHVEKIIKIKDIFESLPYPKNIITSYYLMTNGVNCENMCDKLGIKITDLIINAEYNIDAYKSFSDIMKTMDDKDARHLVDLNLLKGYVDVLSDEDFHKEIAKWVSKKDKIFGGEYKKRFLKNSSKYFTKHRDSTKEEVINEWYKNLMSDGAIHLEGVPRVSKTFFFSTKTPTEEWNIFMNLLHNTQEPMISYPSQKNELGKTRAIANTNILSHYIMTLIYTIFLMFAKERNDPELYALLNPNAQNKLFADISEKMSLGYVSNSIDQSHFDWNVRKYQILSVSENIFKLTDHFDNEVNLILDRINNGLVKTKIGVLRHEDGLLSGWKTTSLFGSIINKLQATVIEEIAQEIEPLFDLAVLKAYMGDDVIHIYRYRRDAMLINSLYKTSGLEVSYSKTIISNAKAEFLRTQIYPGNVKLGYPGRAVTSIFISKPWNSVRRFNLISWCTNTAVYYRRTQSISSKLFVLHCVANITRCTYTKAVNLATTPSFLKGLNMWSGTGKDYAQLKVLHYNNVGLELSKADKILGPITISYFKSLSPDADASSYIFPELMLRYRSTWIMQEHEYAYIVSDYHYSKRETTIPMQKEPCCIKPDAEHIKYSLSFLRSFSEPLTGIWPILLRKLGYKDAITELDSIKTQVFKQSSRIRKYHNMSSRLMTCLITGKVGSPYSYEFSSSDQSLVYQVLIATSLMRRPFLSSGIHTLVDMFSNAMVLMHDQKAVLGYDYW